MKHCSRCDQTLSTSSFHRDKRRKDGFYPWCKVCRREYNGSKPLSPAKFATKADYDREYRTRNPLTPSAYWRKYLWSTYRLEVEEYDALLHAQGGGCAICGGPPNKGTRGTDYGRYCVDHDHSCCPGSRSCGGCVRGLLCTQCNTALGMLRDDVEVVTRAATYLTEGGTGHLHEHRSTQAQPRHPQG